jgi:hypothetical protein
MSRTTFARPSAKPWAALQCLSALGSALFQFLQQQRAAQQQQQVAQEQFLVQQRSAHDLLISNQVSKGFEQLASNEPIMRLGGVYALEGVMRA